MHDVCRRPHIYNGKRISMLAYFDPDRSELKNVRGRIAVNLPPLRANLVKWTGMPRGFVYITGTLVCIPAEGGGDQKLKLTNVTRFDRALFYHFF